MSTSNSYRIANAIATSAAKVNIGEAQASAKKYSRFVLQRWHK
jgi:hypothetical protein